MNISERLAQARAAVDAEFEEWKKANLPPPGNIWRLGDNEFMIHVHIHALTNLLKRYFSEEEIELAIQEEFLKQTKELRPVALKARRDGIRQSIVDGIGIVRPPEV